VGIMTEKHDCENIKKRLKSEDVIIGKNCWIGIGAIILPGVILGHHTVVGAGAIVTKSFPEGHVVIAGNPAKVIRDVERGDLR
jgi:acetyltransferase-like isoleucine patch superfamily enzyme